MKRTIKHLASAMAVAVFLFIAFGSDDDYQKGDGAEQIYYENGELKSEIFASSGVSTNIFNDPISGDCVKKHYFDSGKIFLEDTYKDGKKVESVYFHEISGNDGYAHKTYHTNGTIKEERSMDNDSNIGLRREYNENGTLIKEWVKKNGENDIVKDYDENGQNVIQSYHYNPQINKHEAEVIKSYTYHENFNLKSKTIYETHFEKEGSKWTITKFCYDESGIEIPCP